MVLRAYKYRLYPTAAHREMIDKTISCCRFVYNLALETKIVCYRDHGKNISAIDLCYQLAELKRDCQWLAEVDSQALQASIKKLDVAFKNFYRGSGFPNFRSKRNAGSFQCPNNTRKVDFEKATLTIPKIKNIPIVLSRRFDGKIKTITISKTATGKYFASVLVETTVNTMPSSPILESTTIGIDLGIKNFAILSNGETIANPKYLRESLQRLKTLQRRASRKMKGGRNRTKANLKVALLHERIANKRQDFLHKVSSSLVRDSQTDTICLETLAVNNLIKNHKLGQAIGDVSWAKFVYMLEYKANQAGVNVIRIGRLEASSKTCSACGFVNKELKLLDRNWTCIVCGVTHDRDINAAINIKRMGLKQSGLGKSEEPVETPSMEGLVKQEIAAGNCAY